MLEHAKWYLQQCAVITASSFVSGALVYFLPYDIGTRLVVAFLLAIAAYEAIQFRSRHKC